MLNDCLNFTCCFITNTYEHSLVYIHHLGGKNKVYNATNFRLSNTVMGYCRNLKEHLDLMVGFKFYVYTKEQKQQ